MRRTPIVLTATVAGVAGVLAFHTSPTHLGTLPAASAPTDNPTTSNGTTGTGGSHNTTTGKGTKATGHKATPSASATGTGTGTGTKTVNGPSVNYSFGVLSVAVTVNLS